MYTRTHPKVSRAHDPPQPLSTEDRPPRRQSPLLRLAGALMLAAPALTLGALTLLRLAPSHWPLVLGGLAVAGLAAVAGLGAVAAISLLMLRLFSWLLMRLGRGAAWLVTPLASLPLAVLSLLLMRVVALLYLPLFVAMWLLQHRPRRDRLPPGGTD